MLRPECRWAAWNLPRSFFDEFLQTIERLVPLVRDAVEVAPRLGQPLGVERPDAFPPTPDVMDETGTGENVQMLGDGLAGDGRAGGEPRGRERPVRAQARDQ